LLSLLEVIHFFLLQLQNNQKQRPKILYKLLGCLSELMSRQLLLFQANK